MKKALNKGARLFGLGGQTESEGSSKQESQAQSAKSQASSTEEKKSQQGEPDIDVSSAEESSSSGELSSGAGKQKSKSQESSSSSSRKLPTPPPKKSSSSASEEEQSSSSSSGESSKSTPKLTPKKPSPAASSEENIPQPKSRKKFQPRSRPGVPRQPIVPKKSEYELKTGGGMFYVIRKPSNDDKNNRFKRTRGEYRAGKKDPKTGDVGDPEYGESEPSFFSPEFKETKYKQDGVEPTYSELADWNRESYTKFIQEPAVRFARAVAGKFPNKKWQEFFENPDEALIEYQKNSIPRDTENLFGRVDMQAIFDALKNSLMDPNATNEEQTRATGKAAKDLQTLKKLWNLASSSHQQAKEVVAREVFLTTIYHAPYVIFSAALQTAVDTVISHIKDHCTEVRDFDKNIIFGHLIESDQWLSPFVEAVANRMIESTKAGGYSRSVVQARYDNLHYVLLISRFKHNYKFDSSYIARGTDKTLDVLNKSLGL